MRNPVGPLPSSIYWRRRAVAVLLIALLAALAAWAVTRGGGGGPGRDDGKPGGKNPAPSITPGPSGSGPVVGQPPGGRDESGGNGTGTDGGSAGGGGGAGAGGEPGSAGEGGSTASGGAAAAGSSTGADAGSTGQQVPASSSLPNCKPAALQLSVKTDNSFGPDDRPRFRLTARNTSAADCKADFGPKNAVLTITEAGEDDEQLWSSQDCPRSGALFLRIPAGATVVHTVEWDRRRSAPKCATPPPGSAAPGTYLLEARIPGESVQRASFVLAKD
ncbi:hypothetical protein [Streptomyces sp. NPDC057428]|uniref:hypothetical protein n=1 Tax=Streptomyces sp. NPDC057428 TaxID=3346129 RepID=UPI00368CA676